MIKNIYFYWGNDTMSYMRYMTLYSFCKFNPDWTVYLIKNNQPHERCLNNVTEKQDKTEYTGKDYLHLTDNLKINIIEFENSMIDLEDEIVMKMSDVHIKDILNWKILSEQGGVVADMDILFIKPLLDEINMDVDVGLVCFDTHPKKDYIPVTFMYSSGKNIFFEGVYKNALKNYNSNIYESCGTLCIEERNIQEISNNFPNLRTQRLNDSIVFPFVSYPWLIGMDMLYKDNCEHLIHKDSIGMHWYGGFPLSQTYNNLINDMSVNNISNTVTNIIKRINNK